MIIPLNVSGTAVFVDDGNGSTVASTILSPTVFGSTWNVGRVVVSSNSALSCRFYLYLNMVSASALIDGTYSGQQDTNELTRPLKLQTLDKLICVWTAGTIGANCTVTITGDMDTGRL